MDRTQAIQEIRRQISCTEFLEKSKSGLYCCPYCESGKGAHKTGALKLYNTNTWTCHACKRSGDVIDLYQQATGTDFNTAFSLLADKLNITIDQYRPAEPVFRPQERTKTEGGENMAAEKEADYTAYYEACRERITDPAAAAYLQSRGISIETAQAYWIGYDPAADPASAPGKAGGAHPCQRIIIPTSKAHYVGRSIEPGTPKAYTKLNAKGSTPAIFNIKALYAQDVQEVFITEGAFDALSILEAGYNAIALNSAGNFDALLKQLEQRRTAATLILCPDNDADPSTKERVNKLFAELAAGLQRLNISHITADICAGYKDPNEALTADKGAFIEAVARAQRQTAAKPDNTAYYIDALMDEEIERFKDDKKTGFKNLDEKAGGLYSGLYVLAAISSLGKTSFSLQMADQLAESGNDVIFFSLEQSRLELVSKSLARMIAQKDINFGITSLMIRKQGKNLPHVRWAALEYKDRIGDRMSIVEGNFKANISFIGDYVREYMRKNNGARPVIFVDYLQILQPAEDMKRQGTKENIDYTVTELKRLSRELDLTIIVISSVNRGGYLLPIDFESLKESGGIEYSADVIWGLQLQCLNDPVFEKGEGKKKEQREKVKEAKAENPRKIELTCLKNRYGIANYSCYFDYYPANDLFKEGSTEQASSWTNAKKI